MAFKTKSNKFAFVKGLIAGAKGKKPFKRNKKPKKNNDSFVNGVIKDLRHHGVTDLESDKFVKYCRQNDFIPYNLRQEIVNSKLWPEVSKAKPKKDKPVYDYSTSYDFDKKGRIKGGYTADGFFEPD